MVKIKSRIIGVVLAACLLLPGCAVGTSDYTINQTVSDGSGVVSSTSTALNDNSNLIKQEFQGASERLTDAKSLLLSNITEAQNIISSISPDMLDDPMSLEMLQNLLEEAVGFYDTEIPPIAETNDEIRAQIQSIGLITENIQDITNKINNQLDYVNESKKRYEEEHKSGIIMGEWGFDGQNRFNIKSIDPESGNATDISTFSFRSTSYTENATGNNFWYLYPQIFIMGKASLKGTFSQDYKYMALTKRYGTWEEHAGFIDESGTFYDVTKATNSVRSEFEEPIKQVAIGFTDDNRFIFAEGSETANQITDYSKFDIYEFKVEMTSDGKMRNNEKKPFSGLNNLLGNDWTWLDRNCAVTDWVDSDMCVIDYPADNSKYTIHRNLIKWEIHLLNTETDDDTMLVSGQARTNWSGVVSPDGEKIAFLSAPYNTGDASVYYVSTEGGDPVKICEGISVHRGMGKIETRPHDVSISLGEKGSFCFLMEWK